MTPATLRFALALLLLVPANGAAAGTAPLTCELTRQTTYSWDADRWQPDTGGPAAMLDLAGGAADFGAGPVAILAQRRVGGEIALVLDGARDRAGSTAVYNPATGILLRSLAPSYRTKPSGRYVLEIFLCG
jgi:ABC-type nitrate/sulfonate/bicarbonate transport system substrate-binding protein